MSFGGALNWLTATAGTRQLYRIVDALLASDARLSYAWRDVTHLPRGLLPARALVLGLSPLLDARGIGALLDLRAGRIQAMFQAVLEALPSLRDGATRGLGISSAERVALLPDLPPVADALPGFDVVFWQGLFAPAATPAPDSM